MFREIDNRLNEVGESNSIDHVLAKDIKDAYSHLEFVVASEGVTKKIYEIPKRRFNSDYLLDTPEKLFADDVFSSLSEIAQLDIRSACRCLLFGESTAVAFHVLRATEATLNSYYFKHKRKNRLVNPRWANIVEQLKAKKTNKPPEHLLESLDIIRKAYRNPTQHPDATYEIDSAQDLFGVCLDVIGKMGKEF